MRLTKMNGKRRVFYSGITTETNTFSNIPTTYASFEDGGIKRGREIGYTCDDQCRPEFVNPTAFLNNHQAEFVFGLLADAAPGAPTQHEDYQRLRDELIVTLREAYPVDAVVLWLHGAMISTACDDCEGDILRAVREEIGENIPLVAVLDPHAHLTDEMVSASDFLVFMKEYPHVDGIERHLEALQVVADLWSGKAQPIAWVEDCELIGFFPTQDKPMRDFVDELFELESKETIRSVSFIHGFPWGDHPEMGAKILMYGSDETTLRTVSNELKEKIRLICCDTLPKSLTIEEALAEVDEGKEKLLIYGDVSDNAGGGAPSDSTFILSALVEKDLPPVLLGCLYDPEAVRFCHQVGVGGWLDLRVGGKISLYSGNPIDLSVEVMGIEDNVMMDVLGLVEFPLGDTAWVRHDNINIVMISIREQTYSPHGFTHLGIDLEDYRAVFVKSTNHFRATFSVYSDSIKNVDTPGAINFQLAELEYRNFTRDYLRASPTEGLVT